MSRASRVLILALKVFGFTPLCLLALKQENLSSLREDALKLKKYSEII